MEEDIITPESQPDESHVDSPDDKGTVSVEPKNEVSNLTLQELNSLLGKNFKDKDTALKSLKDTYSYVGKRKEDIIKEVSSNNQNVVQELKEIKDNLFFKDHPELASYRKAYEKVGGNPEEFFNSEEFKPIFEKAKGFDENQKLKSVLISNPRLAQTKDALTKARETTSMEERETLVAQAVLGTLEE